jgi:asparagine synthase (glutamine-hydrolysing)
MCGIVAIYVYRSTAPKVGRGELRRLRDPMAAHGPDGTGLWFSDHHRFGLAHRRLAILDLSVAGLTHGHSRPSWGLISWHSNV